MDDNMYSKSAILIALLMAATGVTAGVSTIMAIGDGTGDHGPEMMPAFSSYYELSSFFDKAVGGDSSYWGTSGGLDTGMQKEAASGSPDYSRTNVQVEGIDEADVVKTDGEYIYSASYDSVAIIRAYPPSEMSLVATIGIDELKEKANDTLKHPDASFVDMSIAGLYVLPGKLVVIASVYFWSNYYYGGGYPTLAWDSAVGLGTTSSEQTLIIIYDISVIETPAVIESFSISGYSLTSRMQDGIIYSVSQQYVWKDEQGDYEMPERSDGGDVSAVPLSEIHYDPDTEDAGYYLNILAVDTGALKAKSKSIVAGWASTIYMSPDSLYLTIVKWPYSEVIVFGDTIVRQAFEDSRPTTTIYRVDVDGLSMRVSAKGDVRGLLLNQFSMDEKDGYLRLASYSGDWQDRRNAVYVLDSNLTAVGSIEDIAINETIQSSRFIGDTLYLVTFRQVDPLFVIDLSVPEAPVIIGELTVPGFSTYLHPVDDDHILGIGSEGSSTKISLFDVSDPTEPREVSKYLIGNYSYSTASWEHKAVLFDAEKELLVIPASMYDYSSYNSSSGFYVFKVSVDSGISLRGTISHDNASFYWYGNDRALYIGDYLYTITGSTIKANLLSDLSEAGELQYREEPYYVIYGVVIEAAAK
jgi:inhibitor of cysteine peptidase